MFAMLYASFIFARCLLDRVNGVLANKLAVQFSPFLSLCTCL